eukprot:scaffold1789_cov200-Skeletonema_marinoi.AAC.2
MMTTTSCCRIKCPFNKSHRQWLQSTACILVLVVAAAAAAAAADEMVEKLLLSNGGSLHRLSFQRKKSERHRHATPREDVRSSLSQDEQDDRPTPTATVLSRHLANNQKQKKKRKRHHKI